MNPLQTKDIWPTLSTVAVGVCLAKFVIEGVSFYYNGHQVTLGHADPMTYGTILGPILAVHGYVHGKNIDRQVDIQGDK